MQYWMLALKVTNLTMVGAVKNTVAHPYLGLSQLVLAKNLIKNPAAQDKFCSDIYQNWH